MKNNRGSILVTTLWIMAILALFAMGIGFRALLELRLSKYAMDGLRARYLAKAGIAKARERLSSHKKSYDTLYECGIFLEEEEIPHDIFGYETNTMEGGSFSVYYKRGDEERTQYGMLDEERKLNINFNKIPTSDKIGDYRKIMSGLSPELTEEIINAMIDWQDGGDFDTETSPGGAEDFYYEAESGYDCKDAGFESVEELLLVKGITEEIFSEIKDYITAYSSGRININTAPREVLNAVINDRRDTYEELLDNILRFRDGADGVAGTLDDGIFTDVSEINFMPAEDDVQGKNRLSQLGPYFTVKSDNFRVISRGKSAGVDKIVTCVLGVEASGDINIKYYHEE
jgi:general secretion pathway protein K